MTRPSGRIDIIPLPPHPHGVWTWASGDLTPPDAFQIRCSRCLSSNTDPPLIVHPSDSRHQSQAVRREFLHLLPLLLLLWPLVVRRQWDAGGKPEPWLCPE